MKYTSQMGIMVGFLMILMSIVGCTSSSPDFTLFRKGELVDIYVGADEVPQIKRAARDLQRDLEEVTGVQPRLVSQVSQLSDRAVLIASAQSELIQELTQTPILPELQGLKSMRESFLLKMLETPIEGVDEALLVTGSDMLGTIYGIYDISERIGVSPFHWWSDVQPLRQKEVVLTQANTLPQQPSIKFRGIFINDEEAMTNWSRKTSKIKDQGHPSPEVYARVFELLLRLKANTIWPAMMRAGNYFYEARDDQGKPINPQVAQEYGIYIGSSHCENMGRNNYDEWHPWAEAHADQYDAVGVPEWDYTVNPLAIEAYWQERINEAKEYNQIYTMGMRGVHDSPFVHRKLKNPTLENRVALLQRIIDRQREMIKETFGAEDAVPQIFVPYEEANELYNGESVKTKEKCKGLDLPEDIILVWTEDNFGFDRQLPSAKDRQRKGGNGLYYHISYQGYPSAYDWIATLPLPLMHEQLHKAYDAGAQDFWIVNVGDLNPSPLALKYFMEIAYDVDRYKRNEHDRYLTRYAKEQYALEGKDAQACAELITQFHQYAAPQKPEFMVPFWTPSLKNDYMYHFYSLFDFGDESQIRIDQGNKLEAEAQRIYGSLCPERKDAFFHHVLYPIRAIKLMLEKTTYSRKNRAYAKQGRYRSVNAYQQLSHQAEAEIQKDIAYYDTELAAGKWNGIMDPYARYNLTERIYDVANIPNRLLYETKYEDQGKPGMGAVCEGQELGTEPVTLKFSSFEANQRFIDIFSQGEQAPQWAIESDVDWVKFSQTSGDLKKDVRLWAYVDWTKAPVGKHQAHITVTGDGGFRKSFDLEAEHYDVQLIPRSFIEGCGFVTLEAEHFSQQVASPASQWLKYEDYGYRGASMFVKGGTKVTTSLAQNAARLEYQVYFSTPGLHHGYIFRIPTLNEGKGNTCQIAIGLNEEQPQVLSGVRHKGERVQATLPDGSKEAWMWHKNVIGQMERMPFQIEVKKPGYHTVKVYQVDTHIGFDKIVICTDYQAEQALARSVMGPYESYNNVIVSYANAPRATDPSFARVNLAAESYRPVAPMRQAKFNFAIHGTIAHDDYIPVSMYDVYNPKVGAYGWRVQDKGHIRFHHNESAESEPFWKRDLLHSTKPAQFIVNLEPGTYELELFTGSYTNHFGNTPGPTYKMSVSANGKPFIRNEFFTYDRPTSRTCRVVVKAGEELKLDFRGKWGASALEVRPL